MTDDPDPELAYWRSLAEVRGQVIQALHEFNYWHESSVARGEVIAGLEQSVELWRERCERAEARLAAQPTGLPRPVAVLRGGARRLRHHARRLWRSPGTAE